MDETARVHRGTGGAAAWSLEARAQQPSMPAIGFLSSLVPPRIRTVVEAFRQGLNEAGYVEGQNVAIEFRWAEGHFDRLPAMAAELVSRQVAVIVGQAVIDRRSRPRRPQRLFRSFLLGSDFPVKVGLVASLNRPGGNVTGVSLFTSELEAKS